MSTHTHTIQGVFPFDRPTKVYKEMYGMKMPLSSQTKSHGVAVTIGVALVIVAGLALGLRLLAVLFQPEPAHAATEKMVIKDDTYAVAFQKQSLPDPMKMMVGEKKTVIITFKNTGTATLNPTGSRFVSAFTLEPKYRSSIFASPSWRADDQTASIKKIAKPGEIVELSVDLTATKEGKYREEFQLAAENHTWIKGGRFFLDIVVGSPVQKESSPSSTSPMVQQTVSEPVAPKPPEKSPYEATLVVRNKKSIEGVGGEASQFFVKFKNTGTATWSRYALVIDQTQFGDSSWLSQSVITKKEISVDPGAFAEESFILRAPTKTGTYSARVYLQIDGKMLSEPLSTFAFAVKQDADAQYVAPILPTDTEPIILTRFSEEPRIRVGVHAPKKPESVTAVTDDFIVFAGTIEKGILSKGKSAVLSQSGSDNMFKSDDVSFSIDAPIRLVPKNDPHAVFELTDYIQTVAWKKGTNFNQFRGVLEFTRGKKDGEMWFINELGLEEYTAGIRETSNDTSPEYQKALQTAARTYAFKVAECHCKYGVFDVTATTADQLYMGYISEILHPNVTKATQETRGYMVTHKSDIVITPYFSQTDGKTSSWSEVWGGKEKPWLVPVEATYDKRDGVKKWGHGVGMSNRDALIRAKEEGINWQDLLKYYYQGTVVERIYP